MNFDDERALGTRNVSYYFFQEEKLVPIDYPVIYEQSEDTKDRILRVAADLFMRQGYGSTSVREIGQHAGISQSALYHHIQSKSHLLKALHERFISEMLEQLEAVAITDGDALQKLRGMITVVMTIIESHQPEVTVFLREQHSLPASMRQSVVMQRDRVDQLVDGVIEAGIASGELRSDLDVRLTRLGILGMCNWAYQWYRAGDRLSALDIAAAFSGIALNGIAAGRSEG